MKFSKRLRAWNAKAMASAVAGAGLFGLSCAAAASAATGFDGDPAKTDGDKYQVVAESAEVRALRYHDEPGAKTHPHHHPCFLLYALAPFERQLTFPDGSQKRRSFRAGEAVFMPAQSHIGENVGKTQTDALLVELKSGCKSP